MPIKRDRKADQNNKGKHLAIQNGTVNLVLLSDCHISLDNPVARLDNLQEVQWKKLKYIWDWANNHQAVILQAGDFVDGPRSWYLLELLHDWFSARCTTQFMGVRGQHDNYLYTKDLSTTMGILIKTGLIRLLTSEPAEIGYGVADVYGCSYGEEVPEVEDPKAVNILVIHAPISDVAPNRNINYMNAKEFLREHKQYDLILCGDIHHRFVVKEGNRAIVNAGCLLRRDVSDESGIAPPGFFTCEIGSEGLGVIAFHPVPHAPADQVLTRSHIDSKKESKDALELFIHSVEKGTSGKSDLIENLKDAIRSWDLGSSVKDVLKEYLRRRGKEVK